MKNLWRQDFPQLKPGKCYLDSAAMSFKPESVIQAVDSYYRNLSVNVHRGMYEESIEATNLYESSRETIARFIHALPEETIFTSGATAGLNMVAFSYGLAHLQAGDEIITTELEHHSSFLPWQVVAQKTKAQLKFVPLSKTGRITVEAFRSVLTEKTKVVAITYVSNVMGYTTPIQEIISLAHQAGAIVVLDAAQAVQHLDVDVKSLDVDFLAFSGHKMLGPTGIGILYGKKSLLEKMEPFEYGGDMNDRVGKFRSEWKELPYRFEAGTMPVASAIGLAKAVRYLEGIGLEKVEQSIRALYKYTYTQLKKIPEVEIYNPDSDTGIIAFNLKNVPSHDAVTFYADKNVAIRSGHHCAQLVTKWLGIDSCLRASFFLYNDFEDADQFIQTTKEAILFFRMHGFEVV